MVIIIISKTYEEYILSRKTLSKKKRMPKINECKRTTCMQNLLIIEGRYHTPYQKVLKKENV